MTTSPTQPDLLATDLRRICGHDSRSVDGCVTCEAADCIESLAAHRGEVVPYGYVMRCDSYRRQPEFYDTKPGFVPPISTLVPVYIHPPQAQAGAGGAIPKASPLPTQADLFSAMHSTLGDAANAVKVLSTMLKKEGLREGLAVADEILGNIKHVLAALEASHEPE